MNPRSILHSLLAAAFAIGLAAGQDAPAIVDDEAFSNLPEEKRNEFVQHMQQASKLFAEKRIFETLEELSKAEAIYPDSAALVNIQGSCYVEFRDFERARKTFQRALKLAPDTPSIRFNIAEVDFCTKQWQQAHDSFSEILKQLPEEQTAMRRLVEFKMLLCKLKIGQVDEARKMVDNHGFMDDSPYHFFAQAALAFHDGKTVDAEQWLGRGTRIFRNPQILAPWQDTMIEFGYIKSFYGGDLADE